MLQFYAMAILHRHVPISLNQYRSPRAGSVLIGLEWTRTLSGATRPRTRPRPIESFARSRIGIAPLSRLDITTQNVLAEERGHGDEIDANDADAGLDRCPDGSWGTIPFCMMSS